jgi:hypothetical protein
LKEAAILLVNVFHSFQPPVLGTLIVDSKFPAILSKCTSKIPPSKPAAILALKVLGVVFPKSTDLTFIYPPTRISVMYISFAVSANLHFSYHAPVSASTLL